MAAPTNTTTTLVSVGNREDLENVIYRVAPEATPFVSNIGKDKASATYHEWQTETLRAPGANAALEGDDVSSTLNAPNLTTRVGNRCQIFTENGGVSMTQEEVNKAGRDSELARQKLLKGKEVVRDIELRFVGNFASNVESGATPRRSAGALAWLSSNVSRGAGGSSGGFSAGNVAAATNGTQRTFTETLLKGVLATAFSNGAPNLKIAMMGPTHKQQFSAFTGIADIRKDAGSGQATIVGAADVYVSDFGELTLVPHPYALTRDCLIIDPDMWAVGTLRAMKTTALAKAGDNERFLMTAEKTLICRNERGSAVIADLT